METSNTTTLVWNKPANIHRDIGVNYTVTINSNRRFFLTEQVAEQVKFSHDFLERDLAGYGECEAFRFQVVAHLAGVSDSKPVSLNDTLPHGRLMHDLSKVLIAIGKCNFILVGWIYS